MSRVTIQARDRSGTVLAEQDEDRDAELRAQPRPPEQWPEHNPCDDEDPGPEGRP